MKPTLFADYAGANRVGMTLAAIYDELDAGK